MIDVDAVVSRIGRFAPDASCHEHREAAVKLIFAYDGNEKAICRVLSFVEGIAQAGGLLGPNN